ncbi:hypothetical protein [Paractinoplanes toevensis]|uniref:Uncharacterized protein n=1 Tax=Paractinoplanes toevensis TaxID=571911 RepID=A0A919W369_9ACTN|nr:hypothetical protein [Actinoplanes toevensis]GIM88803.1 hypothetical protein Ato02nite_005960 [Actinoplanes toevensis]
MNGEILNAMARLGGQYAAMGMIPRSDEVDDEPRHDEFCLGDPRQPCDRECGCWCHGDLW